MLYAVPSSHLLVIGFLFPCSLFWLLFPVLWSSSFVFCFLLISFNSCSLSYPLIPVPRPCSLSTYSCFSHWFLFPVLLFLFPDFLFLLPALWFLLPLIWFLLLFLWFLFFVPVSNFFPGQWITVIYSCSLISDSCSLAFDSGSPVQKNSFPFPVIADPCPLILFPVLLFLFPVIECLSLSFDSCCPLILVLYPNLSPNSFLIPIPCPLVLDFYSDFWFLCTFLFT